VKPGQAVIANNNGTLVVMLVAAVAPQPLSAEKAKQVAGRILTTQKQREAAEQVLKALRNAAKIEYVGSFADAGKEPAKPAAPANSADQPAAAAAQPAVPNDGQPGGTDAAAMKKGLSGL
jgi:hypothetical protein